MDAKWDEHMKKAQEKFSLEGTPKKKATKPGWDEQLMEPDKKAEHAKKAATRQSPSLSKQKTAAPVQLTRAPIGQLKTKQTTHVFQEPQQQQLVPQVVEPLLPGVPLAELAPVAVAPPPAAEQQPEPEETGKRTRVEIDEEFQIAV